MILLGLHPVYPSSPRAWSTAFESKKNGALQLKPQTIFFQQMLPWHHHLHGKNSKSAGLGTSESCSMANWSDCQSWMPEFAGFIENIVITVLAQKEDFCLDFVMYLIVCLRFKEKMKHNRNCIWNWNPKDGCPFWNPHTSWPHHGFRFFLVDPDFSEGTISTILENHPAPTSMIGCRVCSATANWQWFKFNQIAAKDFFAINYA